MKYKLGILGLGKMGSSILSGIIKSNIYDKDEILLFDINQNTKEKYLNLGFTFANSEKDLFNNIEIAIIAIKPQMFNELRKVDYSNLNLVIISIAAGKTINDLKNIFGKQKYIRVMPNTPALIMSSASAITRAIDVDDETFDKVKEIFLSIGEVKEIDENLMNEIIPVNGSMPAYLYYFAKIFIEEAVDRGINYETAKVLACKSIIGSAKMILETDKNIDDLINDVCSPGGTTIEGLKVLENENFEEIIKKAYEACVKRAYEL